MLTQLRRRSFLCLVLTLSLLILSSRTAIFSALISLTGGRNDLVTYSIAPLGMQIGGLLSLLLAGRIIRRFPPRRVGRALLICAFISVSGMAFFHDAGPNTLLLLFLLAFFISPFEPLSHYLVGLVEKQSKFRSAHSILILTSIVAEAAANAFASLLYPIFGMQFNCAAAGVFALLSLLALGRMPIPDTPKRTRREPARKENYGGVFTCSSRMPDGKEGLFTLHRLAVRECLRRSRIAFLGMTFVLYVALLSSLQTMVIPLIVSISGAQALALVQVMFAGGFIAGCVSACRLAMNERQMVVALLFNCLLILCGLLQPALFMFMLVAAVTGFFPPIVISTLSSEVQQTSSRELQPFAMSLVSLAGSMAAISGAALILLISFCLRYVPSQTGFVKPLLVLGIAAGVYLLLSLLAAGWLLKRRNRAAEAGG